MRRFFYTLTCFLAACIALAAPIPANRAWVAGWDKPVDPDKDCKFVRAKETLTIEVPGKNHSLNIERSLMNAPRLLRDVEGDFVVQVRVDGTFQPSQRSTTNERLPFVGAGLVLLKDEKTYIRLERAGLRVQGEVKTYTNWELREDGKWLLAGDTSVQPLEDKATYLRLERQGDKLLASISYDGKEWKELKPLKERLPAKLKLGVSLSSSSTDVFAARFDQFQLLNRRPARQASSNDEKLDRILERLDRIERQLERLEQRVPRSGEKK
jgi:regulation of enolase protein 1 (concanavalin A-like superfamily)